MGNDDDDKDKLPTTINEDIDFETLLSKAKELFSSQAGLNSTSKKESLADVELHKAKANGLLSAIANVIAMSHELEILKANDKRFSREKELDVLDKLFDACSVQADFNLKSSKGVGKILDNLDPDNLDDVILGQNIIERSANNTMKIIGSFDKLIALERASGSRPFGFSPPHQNNMVYIKSLMEESEDTKNNRYATDKQGVRKLSYEELLNLKKLSSD